MGTWAGKAAIVIVWLPLMVVLSRGMWSPYWALIAATLSAFVWHVLVRRYFIAGSLAAVTATVIIHLKGGVWRSGPLWAGWTGLDVMSLLYHGVCGLTMGFVIGLPFLPIRRMPPPNPSPVHRFVTAFSWWIIGCLFHFLGLVGLFLATFWIFGDLDPPNTPIRVQVDRVCNVLFPVLFLGLPAFGALWGWLAARRYQVRCQLPGYCRTCDYNLTGNTSGVCPECGTEIEATLGG